MIDAENEAESIAALPPALQARYIAFIVDAQVLNGGFNQFFFNPSGALAPAAPAAFAQLGIPAAGDRVTRALALLEAHAVYARAERAAA